MSATAFSESDNDQVTQLTSVAQVIGPDFEIKPEMIETSQVDEAQAAARWRRRWADREIGSRS